MVDYTFFRLASIRDRVVQRSNSYMWSWTGKWQDVWKSVEFFLWQMCISIGGLSAHFYTPMKPIIKNMQGKNARIFQYSSPWYSRINISTVISSPAIGHIAIAFCSYTAFLNFSWKKLGLTGCSNLSFFSPFWILLHLTCVLELCELETLAACDYSNDTERIDWLTLLIFLNTTLICIVYLQTKFLRLWSHRHNLSLNIPPIFPYRLRNLIHRALVFV